jgi:adenosylhomocysteine nucleosidase
MSKILLVIALEEEAKHSINSLRLRRKGDIYYGCYNNHEISLIIAGIGKTNTAISVTNAINKSSFDYAINIGAAGATDEYKQGDKVIIERAKYHDFNLELFGYKKGQVPGYPEYFVTNSKLVFKFSSIKDIKVSQVFTGDYFVEKIELDHNNYLVDMESTSFFQALFYTKIKTLSFKIVSDIINGNNYETYSNFEQAKIGLYIYDFLIEILEVI